ncbi:branched chain amino acid/phenylalanine ABC transporter ATP binding subunit LivF [Hyphomicrobiales bacterium]|nr:branched chain amino acid/phenylalanine ABC transporter ATP binding subunit LivF [Hyphomicrobiales bacterium]CAH1695405.1 branched chain amino acid/phenylalanine ABC transporter ATP binding subunit LivF [Hyphomicrobiales bacterium]
MLLETRDLHVSYGPIVAVRGVSLAIPQGHIVSIVGANGAGKSTIVRAISGELAPARGEIVYRGASLSGIPAFQVARRGIVQCPEGRRVFAGLSVMENLRLGAYGRGQLAQAAETLERIFTIFPRLKERRTQTAGTLSGGEQQMLAIGRAMMAAPDILLLDEPSLGLAPILVQTMFEAIRAINAGGTSVLLIEQNAFMALNVAHYAYVLRTGTVVAEGPGIDLLKDEDTIRAYLG